MATPRGDLAITTPLLGRYNLSNLLAAVAAAEALGLPHAAVAAALAAQPPVPGRLEPVDRGQPFPAFVDYAHTDAALVAALGAVREIAAGPGTDGERRGRVAVVFGCGGERDPGKRPVMGKVAGELADLPIATSDNPRREDPLAILAGVEEGLKQSGNGAYRVVPDRREAIRAAVGRSRRRCPAASRTGRCWSPARGTKRSRWWATPRSRSPTATSSPAPSRSSLASGRIGEAAAALGARLLAGDPGASWEGAAIDSRAVRGGEVFFALAGSQTDGHRFVADALARGAAAAVVSRAPEALPETGAVLVVEDSEEALHDLARAVRRRVPERLVGITGSAGKTTTKELLAALLGARFRVARNPGNFNNLFGFPLSLLNVPDGSEWMVAEMGMSTPGELRQLSLLGRPDVAIFTVVRPVHLEFFGTVQAIAEAKSELLAGLSPDGLVIANADDPEVVRIVRRHDRSQGSAPGVRIVWYGVHQPADVSARDLRPAPAGEVGSRFVLTAGSSDRVDIALPLHGLYNVENFLAAAACAHALGLLAGRDRGGRRRGPAGRRARRGAPPGRRPHPDRRLLQLEPRRRRQSARRRRRPVAGERARPALGGARRHAGAGARGAALPPRDRRGRRRGWASPRWSGWASCRASWWRAPAPRGAEAELVPGRGGGGGLGARHGTAGRPGAGQGLARRRVSKRWSAA